VTGGIPEEMSGETEVKQPRLTIATKLYVVFALLAAVTVALALVAVFNARHHAALTDDFEAALAGAKNVERVNSLIYAVVMESRGIYMSSDIPTAKKYGEGLLVFNDRIGQVVGEWQRSVRSDDAERFAAFSQRIKQFQEFRRELVRRGVEIDPAAGREWGDNDANRSVRTALNNDLEALAQLYAKRSEDVYAQIDRGIDSTAWLLSVLSGVAVLLAGAGAVIIWRAIVRPLAEITHVTAAVAGGASAVTIPFGDRGDEIGALARSIAVFQHTMRRNEELNQATRVAEGRARHQEKIAGKIARFSAEIETTLGELGRISENMLKAATRLSGAADHAAARTGTATTASSEASTNVREIASAADELALCVSEIDRHVAQSNAIANKAVSEAEETNATVKELNEAASRIGDVVRLITDIAEQTNLLALNATIEAARAGEAGRGFAVVASEVKALAGQTARAIEDIGAQIAAMQHATLRSIETIGAIERTVRDIGGLSGIIAAAVTQQGTATRRIARSAEIAAKRTVESAGEVERVNEAAADTRASATAVKSVADDLGTVAGRIRSQIDQFFQQLHAA
jgi:methyl-accepting chemotaxis protein